MATDPLQLFSIPRFADEVELTNNTEMTGKLDNFDVVALAKDVIVAGDSVSPNNQIITGNNPAPTSYSILVNFWFRCSNALCLFCLHDMADEFWLDLRFFDKIRYRASFKK